VVSWTREGRTPAILNIIIIIIIIIIGVKRQILHPHDDATKSADTPEESESRF
jgi:hypothetical protein